MYEQYHAIRIKTESLEKSIFLIKIL